MSKQVNSAAIPIARTIESNQQQIQEICCASKDINYRELTLPQNKFAMVVFTEGLTDKDYLSETLLKPLMMLKDEGEDFSPLRLAREKVSSATFTKELDLNLVIRQIISGGVAFFMDGYDYAICFDMRSWSARSVGEPATESSIRGPREGFVETLRINMSMLRRKLKHDKLVFELLNLGTKTNTDIALAYLADVVKVGVVEEVRRRLQGIDMDSILESGYIEQLIEDAPYSIFPTIGNSEKPDKIAAKLLEGRVAILVDGTPMVLTVPNMLVENFQCSEDYYSRPYFCSLIRILRFLSFIITIYLPAIYIAFTTYHQELIPYGLMLNAVQADDSKPLPASLSLILMILVYEMIREGGVRLPSPAGHAVSIVGALVIGDAAVSAGLVNELIVIVVAFTAISSFVVNSLLGAASLLRFGMLILATFSGFFGIIIGTGLLLVHLLSLRSFGVPYLMPFVPYQKGQLRDTLIRFPWWMLGKRPQELSDNTWRQGRGQKPAPPQVAQEEQA